MQEKKRYAYAPELVRYARFLTVPHFRLTPFLMRLAHLIGIVARLFPPRRKGISLRKVRIPGYQKGNIHFVWYEPIDRDETSAVVLFVHGGGFFLKGARHSYKKALMIAAELHVCVAFVEYRVMPKFCYPYPLEDTYKVLEHLADQASQYGIDKEKILAVGDSAGGNIAAALPFLSRDRKGPKLVYQMLVFPLLDNRMDTESMRKFVDTPGWNSHLNHQMWDFYLKGLPLGATPYYAPSCLPTGKDLPPAYIEAEEYDCLMDEAKAYANTLSAVGVETEFHLVAGAFHGFDMLMKTVIAKATYSERIEALRKAITALPPNPHT